MNDIDIARLRLQNQKLLTTAFTKPVQVVSWLGAVQAQDYAGAKWAVSQRTRGVSDAKMDQALADGSLLRTHLMRPTWHFVAPEDIRWMLMLTAPRVHAASAYMYRQLELNDKIIRKSYGVLEKTLRDGRQLTRTELGAVFKKAGIPAEGLRLGYFMMSAELDGVICSGGRKGKQFTYALLEERVPPVKALRRDEALTELIKRYFASHGPATLHDFTMWSGLTMTDAGRGIELVKSEFVHEELGGRTFWFSSSISPLTKRTSPAHLLPNYDEYFIGFKDRSAIGNRVGGTNLEESGAALNTHIVFIDGQIVGGWKRAITKDRVVVELTLVTKVTDKEMLLIEAAAGRYGEFLGLPVTLNK